MSGQVPDANVLYKWENVWQPALTGNNATPFLAGVPAHDVVLLRLRKVAVKRKK